MALDKEKVSERIRAQWSAARAANIATCTGWWQVGQMLNRRYGNEPIPLDDLDELWDYMLAEQPWLKKTGPTCASSTASRSH